MRITTVTDAERFERALVRNLDELVRGILCYRTLSAIEPVTDERGLDFIQLAYWALFNDMLAHSMRVLDKHKRSASFWFIYKAAKLEIDGIAKSENINFQCLTSMSEALKHIRDKTLFHIDRDAVVVPKLIWRDAGIKGPELKSVLDDIYIILNCVYKETYKRDFWLPDYDGSDVKQIIKVSEDAGIIF